MYRLCKNVISCTLCVYRTLDHDLRGVCEELGILESFVHSFNSEVLLPQSKSNTDVTCFYVS